MIEFLKIPDGEKKKIYQAVSNEKGVPAQAVEKDVWVTLILRLIFKSEFAAEFIFKGGTSLSKAFSLIKRFSEDIDLGIDREYLGFKGDLSKTKVKKLRKACHSFVINKFKGELEKQLNEYGVDKDLYTLEVENCEITDRDPEVIFINYKTLYEENKNEYLLPRVKIEISARSLIEPNQKQTITSWIDEQFPNVQFIEKSFEVNATNPQKTFLEKIILLHEEFEKPEEKIRHLRMSRHFYDIGQILNSEYGKAALKNTELFNSIINHRSKFSPMKNTDYTTLTLQSLNIIPKDEILNLYKKDYKEMQENMIHGKSYNFDRLISEISEKI